MSSDKLPPNRRIYAKTIDSNELDRQLLQVAKDNGFDTYDEYWTWFLNKPRKEYLPFLELTFKDDQTTSNS